jgi:hypothetical protein
MVTPRDALLVIRQLLSPPTATLSTLVPFTIDRTPIVTVSTSSTTPLPDGIPVQIDVDLNNDGDFTDATEMGYSQSSLFNSAARVAIEPALPDAHLSSYSVRCARFADQNLVNVVSPVETLIVDTSMSAALETTCIMPMARINTRSPMRWTSARTFYALDMISQTWRSEADVNKPVWRHWVEVVVPKGPIQSTALLYISANNNNNFGDPPSTADVGMLPSRWRPAASP